MNMSGSFSKYNAEEKESNDTKKLYHSSMQMSPKYQQYFEDYKVGDIVWAKMSKYPYWPSVICLDPESKIYIKETKKSVLLHVRFCNDNGRRCWVHQVEKYDGKKSPNYFSPTKNKKQINIWNVAVEEADYLMTIDRDRRLVELFKQFFSSCYSKSEPHAKKNSDTINTTKDVCTLSSSLTSSEQNTDLKILKTNNTFVDESTSSGSINTLQIRSNVSDTFTRSVFKEQHNTDLKIKKKLFTKTYFHRKSSSTDESDAFDDESFLLDNYHGSDRTNVAINKYINMVPDKIRHEVNNKKNSKCIIFLSLLVILFVAFIYYYVFIIM